jgi:hypothetical protein
VFSFKKGKTREEVKKMPSTLNLIKIDPGARPLKDDAASKLLSLFIIFS